MNQVTIHLPPPLRPFAEDAGEIRVDASSVGAALEALSAGRPALHTRILTPEGTLRPYVNVFVGERNIRRLEGLDTALADGDVVAIIPAVAGG